MSGITMYSLTEADMTVMANKSKDLVIAALGQEGLLKGDSEVISQDYVVVLHKKGFFGAAWDKFRGIEGDSLYYSVLKAVNIKKNEDDDGKDPAE